MLTIDADALSTIVARVPPEDHFPLALVHTTLRDACHRHRADAGDGTLNVTWTTRATSSVARAQWVIRDFGLTPTDLWCSVAAENGHLDVLKWLREENDPPCPWSEMTCAYAAQNGHLESLKWLRSEGCPWDEWACKEAAANGDLESLKWLRSEGCPWDEWTCAYAARGGHLEVLKWLRKENDPPCPWDEETCAYAADHGHLEVLKWLRKEGCPWDERTCEEAAVNGDLAMLRWLRKENDPPCPWNFENCSKKARHYSDVLAWLRDEGCV